LRANAGSWASVPITEFAGEQQATDGNAGRRQLPAFFYFVTFRDRRVFPAKRYNQPFPF
jgi:hypothetical protein